MNKVVYLIRKSISHQQNKFDRTLLKNFQKNSVPNKLFILISMLVDGTSMTAEMNRETLACSQLVVSNYKSTNFDADSKKEILFSK